MLRLGDLLPKSLFVGINTATILLLPVGNLIRNVAVPERVNCAVPYNPSPERQVECVASQKLTKPLLTAPESVTVAVNVTMSLAETEPLGETTSTVVEGEMTTAFKSIVAVTRIKKPIKSFKADGKTYVPSLWIHCETIESCKKREAIILLFIT